MPGVTDVPGNGTSVTKKPVFMPDVPVFGTSGTVGYKLPEVGAEKGQNWRRQGFKKRGRRRNRAKSAPRFAGRAGALWRAEQKLVFRATARKIISVRPRGKTGE